MPLPQNHKNLFQNSSASDKLNLFQTLLDSRSLNSDEALALLNAIHTELQQPQGHDPSVYVRYARMMQALRRQMPEVHQEVTTKWEQLHSGMQKKVTEDYASEIEPEENVKSRTTKYETPIQEETPKPIPKVINRNMTTKFSDSETEEIRGGEEELEGPEPEEEVEEAEDSKKEEKEGEEEVEKYGEEVEEEEAEEKEEEGKEEETEVEEEEAEEKEEEGKEEDTEVEEEEAEEKEEVEEIEEEKEEVEEEKEEVEEKEQEEEKEETESEVETAESAEETDHMIREAAEAAEEAQHVEVEVEEMPEIEEVEINPGEEEPPMEPLG